MFSVLEGLEKTFQLKETIGNIFCFNRLEMAAYGVNLDCRCDSCHIAYKANLNDPKVSCFTSKPAAVVTVESK